MTYVRAASPGSGVATAETVRTIQVSDVSAALKAGIDDFWAMPTHVIFLAVIYPIIGLVLARVTMGEDLLQLAYPLVAGFALLGPFAAVGLYELSRRRQLGLDVTWSHAFDIFRSPAFGTIAALGAVQMLLFVAWIGTAHGVYTGLFSQQHPQSLGDLLHLALTTRRGWALIVIGNGLGFIFAVVALTLSVISFPLAIDRHVSAAVALKTSVRAVEANPVPMAIWGLVVASSLVVGFVTAFIGLALILPVLGHATWHLYRRVVAPVRAPS